MSLFPKIGRRIVIAVFSLFVVFCLPSTLLGQSISTGTIQGAVTDPTGAAVLGASVALTNTDTSTTRTGTTNDAGHYIFADMPPAKYDITISKTGFRVTKVAGQEPGRRHTHSGSQTRNWFHYRNR